MANGKKLDVGVRGTGGRAMKKPAQRRVVTEIEFADGSHDMPSAAARQDGADQGLERFDGAIAAGGIEGVDDHVARTAAGPGRENREQIMFEVQFVAQGAQTGGHDLIDGKQNDIAVLLKRTGQLVKSPRFPGARQAKDEQVTTGHAQLRTLSPPAAEW